MKSIRSRMLTWFGLTLGILMIAVGVMTYFHIRDTVIPLTRDLMQEVLIARSAEMGRLIHGYLSEVRNIAGSDLMRSGDVAAIRQSLLKRARDINPDFEIVFFADAAGRYITTKDATGSITDRTYWKIIMDQGRDDAISNPLLSYSTGENMFAVASVVLDEKGRRIGIAAATVTLKTLSGIARNIKIGESGAGWIADGTGLCVAHPNTKLPMKLNLLNSAKDGYQGLDEIGRKIVRGEAGQGSFIRPDGKRVFTIFNPIPNTPGWTFGIEMEQSEFMERPERMIRKIAWLMAGMMVVMLLLVIVISGRISRPIRELKEGAGFVSAGNLDRVLQIRTGDEIQALAEAFNKMNADLKAYIENLQRVTIEKERVESDLRVANKIQAGMLPRIFPPFPEIEHLDLYATMEPAREIGGDFYDFCILDDRRLYFSIGDVSGKGIPAALFMVITMTILRNQTTLLSSLEQVFAQTNAMLCSGNDENMFVTLFTGILDPVTGELEYINAGHNPPLLSAGGKDFEYLKAPPGMAMGCVEDYAYRSTKTVLSPGDVLFLYTDGVTEAMNEEGKLFGNERTIQALNRLKGRPVRELIRGMHEDVDLFIEGAPASDDVTMLAVSLTGPAAPGVSPG